MEMVSFHLLHVPTFRVLHKSLLTLQQSYKVGITPFSTGDDTEAYRYKQLLKDAQQGVRMRAYPDLTVKIFLGWPVVFPDDSPKLNLLKSHRPRQGRFPSCRKLEAPDNLEAPFHQIE